MTDWARVHACDRCRVWVRRAGRGLESVALGRLDEDAARAMTAVCDEIIAAEGRMVAFHDWWDSPGYETPHRTWWERWLRTQRRGAIEGVYMLTKSAVSRMGLSLANLMYTHITFRAFKEREPYSAAVAGVLPPRESTPS